MLLRSGGPVALSRASVPRWRSHGPGTFQRGLRFSLFSAAPREPSPTGALQARGSVSARGSPALACGSPTAARGALVWPVRARCGPRGPCFRSWGPTVTHGALLRTVKGLAAARECCTAARCYPGVARGGPGADRRGLDVVRGTLIRSARPYCGQ